DTGFDHRQVEAGRDPGIEQTPVTQDALTFVEVLLVERPADPLHGATLHLAFDVARMDRLAGVLGYRGPQNLDLAGLGIDLDVDAGRCETRRTAARVARGAPGDRAAGTAEARSDFLDGHRLDAVAARTQPPVVEFDLF